MTVLFASAQTLERAEDLKAVWDAYSGEKSYTRLSPWRTSAEIERAEYDLLVTDEVPSISKAPVILLGHGVEGGKLCGLDQKYPYISKANTELLTWVISASEHVTDLMAKRNGVDPSQVLPLGKPKTDKWISKPKTHSEIGVFVPKIYLYAPTYRTFEELPYPEVDFELIDSILTDDEVFIYKPHMATLKPQLNTYKHILCVSSQVPTMAYVNACDVLITDYSSIMFDAHIIGRPVILFEKDKEHYLQERGMYLTYPDDYASRHTTDETELIEMCRNAKEPLIADLNCKEKLCNKCDGHATERIVELIEEVLNE